MPPIPRRRKPGGMGKEAYPMSRELKSLDKSIGVLKQLLQKMESGDR